LPGRANSDYAFTTHNYDCVCDGVAAVPVNELCMRNCNRRLLRTNGARTKGSDYEQQTGSHSDGPDMVDDGRSVTASTPVRKFHAKVECPLMADS
jgi:hypothetical protein